MYCPFTSIHRRWINFFLTSDKFFRLIKQKIIIMTQEQKHSVIQAILTFISSILCAITASSCASHFQLCYNVRGKVPTERTDYTEAYRINISEFTERIDAARHTTESTELIACVATPRLSMVAVYGGARLCTCISFACSSHRTQTSKHSFLWILASRSVGHSVDSKILNPQASVHSAFYVKIQMF